MESILDADILIVDDNKDLLRLLREQLTSAGYRNLRTAKSCALAREAFQAKRPELMILDINLPRMEMALPSSVPSGLKRIYRPCSSLPGMQMPTDSLAWDWGRTII